MIEIDTHGGLGVQRRSLLANQCECLLINLEIEKCSSTEAFSGELRQNGGALLP